MCCSYCAPEELSDYRYEGAVRRATKRLSIARLPQMLTIQVRGRGGGAGVRGSRAPGLSKKSTCDDSAALLVANLGARGDEALLWSARGDADAATLLEGERRAGAASLSPLDRRCCCRHPARS